MHVFNRIKYFTISSSCMFSRALVSSMVIVYSVIRSPLIGSPKGMFKVTPQCNSNFIICSRLVVCSSLLLVYVGRCLDGCWIPVQIG